MIDRYDLASSVSIHIIRLSWANVIYLESRSYHLSGKSYWLTSHPYSIPTRNLSRLIKNSNDQQHPGSGCYVINILWLHIDDGLLSYLRKFLFIVVYCHLLAYIHLSFDIKEPECDAHLFIIKHFHLIQNQSRIDVHCIEFLILKDVLTFRWKRADSPLDWGQRLLLLPAPPPLPFLKPIGRRHSWSDWSCGRDWTRPDRLQLNRQWNWNYVFRKKKKTWLLRSFWKPLRW